MSGPVSRALKGSYLAAAIRRGIQAIPAAKHKHVETSLRKEFQDSIDLDEATRARHRADARWDYLLGHAGSSQMVALEAHPAQTSDVSTVIEKRAASRRHLAGQLQPGEIIAAWYWVASGRVDFVPHEKIVNRLNQNGIQFVGARLEAKHLASLPNRSTSATPRRPQQRR